MLAHAIASRLSSGSWLWCENAGLIDVQSEEAKHRVINTLTNGTSNSTELAAKAHLVSFILHGVTIVVKGADDVITSASNNAYGARFEPYSHQEVFVMRSDPSSGVLSSMRRCGGQVIPCCYGHLHSFTSYSLAFAQGDILAGSIAVAAYWSSLITKDQGVVDNSITSTSHVPNCNIMDEIISDLMKAAAIPGENNKSDISIVHGLSPVQYGNMLAAAFATTVVKHASGKAFSKYHRGMTSVNILNALSFAFDDIVSY